MTKKIDKDKYKDKDNDKDKDKDKDILRTPPKGNPQIHKEKKGSDKSKKQQALIFSVTSTSLGQKKND